MTDDEKMKKADANTVAGQFHEFGTALRNLGNSFGVSAKKLGDAFKKMTAGGRNWTRFVICPRCHAAATKPKDAPMPPMVGLPHSPSCTVELTRACDEAVLEAVKKRVEAEADGVEVTSVATEEDIANGIMRVDVKYKVDPKPLEHIDISLVHPACLLCFVEGGGGWLGDKPTRHDPACNVPLARAADEAVER